MAKLTIPIEEVRAAIAEAKKDPSKEVIGFFLWENMGGDVKWYHMSNSAKDQTMNAEIAAEEIADLIHTGAIPLALFHSHPSGRLAPSSHDRQFFPEHYVDWGFIWSKTMPDGLVRYSPEEYYSVQNIEDAWIVV